MQTSTRPPLFSTDDLEAVSAAFFDEAHLEQTARSILRMIGRRLRADAAGLLVADASGSLHLTGVYNPGELAPPEILDAGPDSLAMRTSLTRQPAAIVIGPDDRPTQSLDGDSARSALALPLLAGSELQGVLVLSRRRRFERRDLRALRHVAHHMALGMRFARLAMRLPERPIGDSDREPEFVSSDPPVEGRKLLDSMLQTLPGDEASNAALARKQVQELAALADGERRRLHAVLENLPVGVVIVEANGSVSLMNREAEHLMGRRFVLGKNVLESNTGYPVYTPHGELIPPDEWPIVRSLHGGQVLRDVEIEIRSPGMQPRGFLVNSSPVTDADGTTLGAVSIFQDLTPLKQIAALQELDHLKAEFIAGVSHELRTPLHYIKGYSSALLRRDLRVAPEELREFLEIIDQQSDKLVFLIDDLLDTSRIEAGVVAVEIQRMDLAAILRRAVDNARKMAPEHRFVLNMPADLPRVEADPRRIEQVLANLLGNAGKYSSPGTTITTGVAATAEEIIVSIQDQGEGISPEHLPHIFEPFYRVSRERERRVSGNGLGLFICRGLIEAQGGTIWAESRPDEGTCLSFTLPRRRPGPFRG